MNCEQLEAIVLDIEREDGLDSGARGCRVSAPEPLPPLCCVAGILARG